MIADSIKLKDYRCFKDEWAGFEEFKPINVIIGRNNSGKSHLLDLVKRLTEQSLRETELTLAASGILDTASLKQKFREESNGVELGQNHWLAHGKLFQDKRIKREMSRGRTKLIGQCGKESKHPAASKLPASFEADSSHGQSLCACETVSTHASPAEETEDVAGTSAA